MNRKIRQSRATARVV